MRRSQLWMAPVFVALLGCSSSQKTADSSAVSDDRLPASVDNGAASFFKQMGPGTAPRHVHMMHLDGWRPDLFKKLVEAGRLPHFAFLMSRGKLSLQASTVDKSETMKIIQAYMTSRRETEVVSWWQWDRESFAFRNYWIDPVEVVNYALGIDFPRYPTAFDVVAAKGGNTASGFGLHRRSVAFKNYARAYVEGAQAVSAATYYNQANATMKNFRGILERIATSGEKLPSLTHSLLACADEFAHLEGVARPKNINNDGEYCLQRQEGDKRKGNNEEIVFKMLEDRTSPGAQYEKSYFTSVDWKGKEIHRICMQVPRIEATVDPLMSHSDSIGQANEETAFAHYALGMMWIDMQLGQLINTLRSIHVDGAGRPSWHPEAAHGLGEYIRAAHQENSLFENTLFLFFGDHGMIDSKHVMREDDPKNPDPWRDPGSMNRSFIKYLNDDLNLAHASKERATPAGEVIGIDDAEQPLEIAYPHKATGWMSPRESTAAYAADKWARDFFGDVKDLAKKELYNKFWWLGPLRVGLINPKLDKGVAPYQQTAVDLLAQIYLKGEPDYMQAEREGLKDFYDQHVRLIYGGGARNNVELFFPSHRGGAWSFSQRPGFDEILSYNGGNGAKKTLLDSLKASPGVGLIFIRKNNGEIAEGKAVTGPMQILVMDRFGNRGLITVERDAATLEPYFSYRLEAGSPGDPLGYGELAHNGFKGTYNQWNDLSVKAGHYYHNAVAGMGALLYSNNAGIGDISVMHAQGWNFGENAGGHGGLHKEEKLTLMLASGPGIEPGRLMSVNRYAYKDGRVQNDGSLTNPTVLDAAPTALKWLGYGEGALTKFSRSGYQQHLNKWVAAQREDILNNVDNVGAADALKEAGFDNLRVSAMNKHLRRLFQFVPSKPPPQPDFKAIHEDGNQLNLGVE